MDRFNCRRRGSFSCDDIFKKVFGTKESVANISNADKFLNFCNDVIGDISGIVSGTASFFVVILQIASMLELSEGSAGQLSLNVLLTSLISAITVDGKILGKFFAINSSFTVATNRTKVKN